MSSDVNDILMCPNVIKGIIFRNFPSMDFKLLLSQWIGQLHQSNVVFPFVYIYIRLVNMWQLLLFNNFPKKKNSLPFKSSSIQIVLCCNAITILTSFKTFKPFDFAFFRIFLPVRLNLSLLRWKPKK